MLPNSSAERRTIGMIEECTSWRIRGWAIDLHDPFMAVELLLRIDGRDVCLFRPQLHMPALARHLRWPENAVGLTAFDIALPDLVRDGQPHDIHIAFADNGQPLHGGPCTLLHQPAHTLLTASTPPADAAPPASPAPALVTIVVLNRNGAKVLHELLTSWEKFNRTIPCTWVVVDHASTDDSLAVLQQWQQRLPLHIHALQENQSFSASCNLGARGASTPYLLFLNNDIVWQQDALPAMLDTLQQSDVCAVGLKLLKVSQLANGRQWAEVQHLGVRFTPHHESYLPYEATTLRSGGDQELEFAAQTVPAVTGAVLLCRSDEFWSAGGFHEDYFYGFEDIELCLRLAHHTGKRIVCRNDLMALHRHGYTRLTGREPSIFQRLERNTAVLGRHIGLWIKRAWWHSLLQQDGGLCAERLHIGLWLGDKPSAARRKRAQALVDSVQQHHPQARIWQISPGAERYDARQLHLLLVATPDYDITQLDNARADLRTIAWIDGPPNAWVSAAHWPQFDAYLATSAPHARALRSLTPYAIDLAAAGDPLPHLARWHQHPWARVRVRIATSAQTTARTRLQAQTQAHAWRDSLKAQGIACWAESSDAPQPHMVDIQVWLGHQPPAHELDPACLNIWWHPRRAAARSASPSPAHPWDWITQHAPTADQLHHALEKKIGHTFHTP